jgi:4-hydroxy-2-oxoheptanedioate aldolase
MAEIVKIAKANNVVVGHPHVDQSNVQRVLDEGYRFLMPAPERTFKALEAGLAASGR